MKSCSWFLSVVVMNLVLGSAASDDAAPKKVEFPELSGEIPEHPGDVLLVEFPLAMHSKFLTLGSKNRRELCVWWLPLGVDTPPQKKNEKPRVVLKHDDLVVAACFWSQKFVATLTEEEETDAPLKMRMLHVWNLEKPEKPVLSFKAGGTGQFLEKVHGHPYLVTASYGGGMKVWDLSIREELKSLKPGTVTCMAMEPRGPRLLVVGRERLSIWDMGDCKKIASWENPILQPAPNFQHAAFAGTNSFVTVSRQIDPVKRELHSVIDVWDISQEFDKITHRKTLVSGPDHIGPISVSWGDSGGEGAVLAYRTSGTHEIQFVDVETGDLLGTFKPDQTLSYFRLGHREGILAVALKDKNDKVSLRFYSISEMLKARKK